MSFIQKIPTTTTTTSTTTTTTKLEVIVPNNDISFSGFGSKTNNRFGRSESSFGRITPNDSMKSVGSVNLEFIKSNATIRSNGNNDYTVTYDIEVKVTNTATNSRAIFNPTLKIKTRSLITGIKSMLSTFQPTNATKKIGISANNELSATLDDKTLNAGQEFIFNITGVVVVSTNGITPQILTIASVDSELPTISTKISRTETIGDINFIVRNILGTSGEVVTGSKTILNSLSTITETYTNNTALANDFFGFVVQYDDSLQPKYYFAPSDTTGVLDISLTKLTTTTTTAPPKSAQLLFNNISPIEGNSFNLDNFSGGINASFDVTIGNSNFSPIPYRIKMVTSSVTAGATIQIKNFIDDAGGDKQTNQTPIYLNGDVIVRDTITVGNINSIYTIDMTVPNDIVSGGVLDIILETDISNTGNYQETDRITYNLSKTGVASPILIDYVRKLSVAGSTANSWSLDFSQPDLAPTSLQSSNGVESSKTDNVEFQNSISYSYFKVTNGGVTEGDVNIRLSYINSNDVEIISSTQFVGSGVLVGSTNPKFGSDNIPQGAKQIILRVTENSSTTTTTVSSGGLTTTKPPIEL